MIAVGARGVISVTSNVVPGAVTKATALALAGAVEVAVDGAVDGDGETDAPGAQALAMIASSAKLLARIPGLRTDRPRVNDPSRLGLNI